MGYMQDADRWLDTLLADFSEAKIGFDELKRAIREKLLESYRNGVKAQIDDHGTRESERPWSRRDERRRFPPRR
jgi:hypothetical protein